MSKLVVYRASAGSGKTFRLAAEYIKQVIANPEGYRHILAVTFTNKATAEMKGRILNELFGLSMGESSGMGNTIAQELNLPLSTIQHRAKQALSFILHDYSRFSVSTIDSFVQRVIQALLWEIGEQGGVDIELDTMPVLEHAADNLLDSASKIDELLKWLTTMGYSLLDEGKSWDVRSKLIELGKQLFSEKFRLMSREDVEKFTDRERVNKLKKQLQKIVSTTTIALSSTANEALKNIEQRGVDIDRIAHGKNGVMGFFIKCAAVNESTTDLPSPDTKRVSDALADGTGQAWVNKANYADKLVFAPIERAVIEVLHPTLTKLIEIITEKQVHYYSAKLILKNLENLALIGDLWSKVRELSREEGFLLLSDSGHLLREFVKESDAPFVYEKVGTRYDMYMIDEFQDTSEVQWHNFKPLIENSLAQDCFSMIVGDVKQSIYRWRNGDWSILASGVEDDLRHFGIDDIALGTNWRSLPAIIDFNNRFFTQTRELAVAAISGKITSPFEELIPDLSEQIVKAYKDVEQKSPRKGEDNEGMVQLKFFEKENNAGCDEFLSDEISTLIQDLRENYELSDMAILVRTKSEGQRIANMLLEHNRKELDKNRHIIFVSQEGLELKASLVVRLTIAAFRLVQDTNNEIAKRVLSKEILSLKNTNNPNWHSCFASTQTDNETDWLSSLNTRPLNEVFEAIAQRYGLFKVEGELAHLAELHEHIASISSKGGGDVNRFLQWWDEKGSGLSLTVPESTNALSIITIHKSKGLQFPVVIIPYANWSFRPASAQPLLWVQSDEEPFNLLPKYPIQAGKQAKQSLFARDVLEEEMRELVDNINMLYVAFTRPERELYVFVPLSKKEAENDFGEFNSVSKIIKTAIPALSEAPTTTSREPQSETFTFGTRPKNSTKEPSDITAKRGWTMDSYPVGQSLGEIKLKMEAEEFFLASPSAKLAPKEHGKIMHKLFSKIETVNDIDIAIQTLITEGLLTPQDREQLKTWISEILKADPINSWFSGEWEVKNEASILTPDGHSYRPDRVMIKEGKTLVVDFKFGGELPAHTKQVQRYSQLLRNMGYDAVDGFIWYVDENRLVSL